MKSLLNIPLSTKVAIRILYLFKFLTFLILLPQKKLSIPTTVSRVLKYIPELQHQVEGLFQKKEELLSKLSSKGDLSHQEVESKNAARRTGPAVSASRLNDRELIIQISKYNIYKCSLSEILLYLEENGLLLLNASSFESFGGRVFYNLHFQVCFVCFCLFVLQF